MGLVFVFGLCFFYIRPHTLSAIIEIDDKNVVNKIFDSENVKNNMKFQCVLAVFILSSVAFIWMLNRVIFLPLPQTGAKRWRNQIVHLHELLSWILSTPRQPWKS